VTANPVIGARREMLRISIATKRFISPLIGDSTSIAK
jgi:hypothetical protein